MEPSATIKDKTLRDIADRVARGIPASADDARHLFTTSDIIGLGTIAHGIRTALNGHATYYGVNMNLNYTNICELRCPLCAYSCDEGDDQAFLLSIDEIERRVRSAVETRGIDEVHIVGGLHPGLKLDYFEAMLKAIKAVKPDINIVAFTAVEYDYFARMSGLPLEEIFRRLIAAGVDALPGGGAEIFAPEVRRVIAPKKVSGDRWLEVMRTAHGMGLKTNATMLYNHRESVDDLVDHLSRIRDLQSETGGFKTFVPLNFHEEHTGIKSKGVSTGFDDIRIYAASRIFLHNVPHIKALWMYLGDRMAQTLQWFGIDDIGATYDNEKVVHAAGAGTPDFGSESHLVRLITEAGMTPVRTTARYTDISRGAAS